MSLFNKTPSTSTFKPEAHDLTPDTKDKRARAKEYHEAYTDFVTCQSQLALLRKVPESTEDVSCNKTIDRLIRDVQVNIAKSAIRLYALMDQNKDLTVKEFASAVREIEGAAAGKGDAQHGGQYL